MIEGSPPPVVFFHLFKCGGTSVIHRLRRSVPRGRFLHVRDPKAFAADLAAHPEETGRYRAIAGHLDIGTLAERLPDARWTTVLRDPVDRMLSQYHHFRRAAATPGDAGSAGHRFRAAFCADNDLAAFVDCEDPRVTVYTRDFMARKLAGWPPARRTDAGLLDAALDRLAGFAAVGTTDTLDTEFLPAIERLAAGRRRLALPARRANVSPGRRDRRPPLDRGLLAAILERNRADAALYAAARWFDPRDAALTTGNRR